MKVLFFITGFGVGGAERQVLDLANELILRKHQVKIVYLVGKSKLQVPEYISVVGLGAKKSPISLIRAFVGYVKLVNEFRPDVIHSHMVHSNIVARLLRPLASVKRLICTAHNVDEGGRLRMLMYRITDRLADHTTNVSDAAVQSFVNKKAASASRIIMVPNAIDTKKFYPQDTRHLVEQELGISNKPIILSVGRLYEQKDHFTFISALKVLKDTGLDFHAVIIGDGPLRSKLDSYTEAQGLTSFVSFLGIKKNIPHYMGGADVFVLSSKYEGFGLVVAEAMACGVPVVSTACEAVAEVMSGHGTLVPIGDGLSLSKAIETSLSVSIAERNENTAKAREHILSNFSIEKVVNRWVELYKS